MNSFHHFKSLFAVILGVSVLSLNVVERAAGQELGDVGGVEAVAEAVQNLEINSQNTTYDETLGIFRAEGNVTIRYGETVIEAQAAEYHQTDGNIYARDDVTVYKDGGVFHAQEIIYDTETGEMTSSQLRSALDPLLYESSEIVVPTSDTDMIEMSDAYFTTHDASSPNFRIKAKTMRIYPGERIAMKGVKFYSGDRAVFYLPYLSQPLDDELGYYFTPGFSSAWGGFLLNQYGFMIQEHTLAQVHLDLRSARGVAGGIEFKSERHRKNPNFGRLKLYYANDSDPQKAFNGGIRGEEIDSSRYRVNLQHRVYLPGPEKSDLYVDIDINKLSDEFFYEDFFPAEYRTDPNPDNVVNVVKRHDRGTISLTGRAQLNDFFQTDERLPELAFDFNRFALGDTGFFYDGYTTFGVINEELSSSERESFQNQRSSIEQLNRSIDSGELIVDGTNLVDEEGNVVFEDYDGVARASLLDDIESQLDPRGFTRFDTYHEFLRPFEVGVFNFVPRAGVGYSDYSSIDSPGADSFDRTTVHAGLDTSFKFSKTWSDKSIPELGLDGVRHVVQPYMNYSYVGTDEINQFTPIDRLTPSTRLRPIDLPLYTSVDDIRDWNIARVGVFNRIQTRRNNGTHNWLTLNSYFDNYIDDPEFDRDFSNFFNEIRWNPLPWLSANVTAQVPIFNEERDFTEITSSLYFMPTDNFQFSVGYFALQDHPFFQDSSLVSLSTYTRLSDEWGFSTNHRFEADDSTLEYQQYQIHKDLASWTAGLGGIIRDNRNGEDEFGIIMSLTLKAFPKVTIPIDLQPGGEGGTFAQ